MFLMLFATLLLSTSLVSGNVVISTKQGEISGTLETASDGSAFSAFRGIPFALPPTGSLRFRPPQPTGSSWPDGQKRWSATKNPPNCLQQGVLTPGEEVIGDEDCLYLNVFTKHPGDTEAKKKVRKKHMQLFSTTTSKPCFLFIQVLVWIHGGAFIFGSCDLYNPQYFMEEDVVLVVIQYRLNIFGYLSAENEELPGNYGSLDQVMALK